MREVLFRGKRKDNGEWVYGSLVIHKDILWRNQKYYYIETDTGEDRFEVIPETVGQYTGLTDKNDKKIFENDLIKIKKYHYYKDKEYLIGNVVFRDGMFEIKCDDVLFSTMFTFRVWSESIEVIGNIYENEDLLRKEVK